MVEIEKILRQGCEKPDWAFAELWLRFKKNRPSLTDVEAVSGSAPESHKRIKAAYTEYLNRNGSAFPDDSSRFPLALLQALDEHLYGLRIGLPNYPAPKIKTSQGDHYLLPVQTRFPIHHARQAGSIRHWAKHHFLAPCITEGYGVDLSHLDGTRVQRLRQALKKSRSILKLYVASFNDGVVTQWSEPWRATGLSDDDARWASIVEHIGEAVTQQAHVLVLPELSVTSALRGRLLAWLAANPSHPFLLIVPGSFHLPVADGKHYNQTVLWDGFGVELLTHCKLSQFGTDEIGVEKIETGKSVTLLQTPIGVMAIPICLDFCDEKNPFDRLWQDLGVEWFWVPSMSETTSAHRRKAEVLWRAQAAVSAVANQRPGAFDPAKPTGNFICESDVLSQDQENERFLVRTIDLGKLE